MIKEQTSLPPAEAPSAKAEAHPDTLGLGLVALDNYLADSELSLEPNKYESILNAEAEKHRKKSHRWHSTVGKRATHRKAKREINTDDLDDEQNLTSNYDEFDVLEFPHTAWATNHDRRQILRRRIDEYRKEWSQTEPDSTLRRELDEAIITSMSPYQKSLYEYWRNQVNAKGKQKRGATDENSLVDSVDWLTSTTYDRMPVRTTRQRRARAVQRRADDQKFMNFLQAHKAYIENRQQSPEFIEQVNRERKRWYEAVTMGVQEGWLHERALDRPDEVWDIRVYEGDAFSTNLRNWNGYHQPGSSSVVVAKDAVEQSTCHELNHALLQSRGGNFALKYSWLYEAITEEIAIAAKGGELGNFQLDIGSYSEERGLLRDLIQVANRFGADIDIKFFTLAYSAPGKVQQRMIENFSETIYRAKFGDMSFLRAVNDEVEKQLNKLSDQEKLLTSIEQNRIAAHRASSMVRSWLQ